MLVTVFWGRPSSTRHASTISRAADWADDAALVAIHKHTASTQARLDDKVTARRTDLA